MSTAFETLNNAFNRLAFAAGKGTVAWDENNAWQNTGWPKRAGNWKLYPATYRELIDEWSQRYARAWQASSPATRAKAPNPSLVRAGVLRQADTDTDWGLPGLPQFSGGLLLIAVGAFLFWKFSGRD